jgi:hypothetical protein
MKNLLLLFCFFLGAYSSQAQTLLWESMPGAGARNNPAIEDALNNSNLSPTNFDNDDFTDIVVMSGIYRDSLFFRIKTGVREYSGLIEQEGALENAVFLGFSSDPTIPDLGDPSFNQLLFGLQRNNRIIGILIAYKLSGSDDFEYSRFSINANYAFLSVDDYNEDEVSEIFLYNADERRVQLWQY